MKNVLVVDHDFNTHHHIEQFLNQKGIRVYFAGDGLEALEKMSRIAIDGIISEMDVPYLGGIGLLTKARERGFKGAFYFYTESGPPDIELFDINGAFPKQSGLQDFLCEFVEVLDLVA